jgi:hypothetical protein
LNSSEPMQNEYDDYFNREELNDELSYDMLSMALHMKERYQNFTFSPPIKQEYNLDLLRSRMKENFLSIYCQGEEFQKLYLNIFNKHTNCEQSEEINVKNLSSKNSKRNRKIGLCEPFNYYENLIEFNKKLS